MRKSSPRVSVSTTKQSVVAISIDPLQRQQAMNILIILDKIDTPVLLGLLGQLLLQTKSLLRRLQARETQYER